jgi:hypothetical protein
VARHIVAVALLTHPELQSLGSAFDRAWPVEETTDFEGLLPAIDDAERKLSRARSGKRKNVTE